jgi:hypothetical protein
MKPKSNHRSERFKVELQKRQQERKPLKTIVEPKVVFDEMVPFKLLSQDKFNVGSNLKKLMSESLELTKKKS